MRNVKFEGIDEDLTAPNTPWIYYGVRVLSLLLSCRDQLVAYYVRCRGRMPVRGRHTCASSTLTSCSVLLRQVVRAGISSPRDFQLTGTPCVRSSDTRRDHKLGIHGRHPACRRPQVLLQPRQLDRYHRQAAQTGPPARPTEKAFWPRWS